MDRTISIIICFFILYIGTCNGIAGQNCSLNRDGSTRSCYTCMGRDMMNCEHGLACCKGSCYKLIDTEHDLIVKGCTNTVEEDASMKVRTLDVSLYWANNDKVKGESFFCNSKDFCNGVPSTLSFFVSILLLIPLLFF